MLVWPGLNPRPPAPQTGTLLSEQTRRQLNMLKRQGRRVQGVRTPPPPEMTCGFLIQLVFCQKKNYVVYWCWSRADPETSAPPPKKNPGSAPERYAFFYFHLFHICRYQKIIVITVFLSTKSLYFEGYMQQSWCSNVGLGLPMVYDINLVCKLKNNNPLGVLELLRPQWCIYVHLF